jgi:hypothetical protein
MARTFALFRLLSGAFPDGESVQAPASERFSHPSQTLLKTSFKQLDPAMANRSLHRWVPLNEHAAKCAMTGPVALYAVRLPGDVISAMQMEPAKTIGLSQVQHQALGLGK